MGLLSRLRSELGQLVEYLAQLVNFRPVGRPITVAQGRLRLVVYLVRLLDQLRNIRLRFRLRPRLR